MTLETTLHDAVRGTHHPSRKRVGRGNSAGGGNTSGRGNKGQKARTGKKLSAKFEGGQMPLVQRIAKRKGFKSHRKFSIFRLNLKDLPRYLEGNVLTVEKLHQAGLVGPGTKVKVLGEGEVSTGLTIQTHFISESARKKIEGVGGTIEIVK